jgi:hypothetical protein
MSEAENTTAVVEGEQTDEVAVLVALLRGGRAEQRRGAALKLGQHHEGAEVAVSALIGAFDDADLEVRGAAVAALARLGAVAVPALGTALRDGGPDVRKVAIVALGEIGPAARAAIGELVELLEDEWLGACALEALRKIKGQRADRGRALRGLALGVFLAWLCSAAFGAGVFGAAWVGALLFGPLAGAAVSAASVLGGVGALLGAILGATRGSVRGLVLGPVLFGLGGAGAGLLLAGLVSALVAPVTQALGVP